MENRKKLIFVAVLNSILFSLFLGFAAPSFYSEEDTHLMYLLSGGYGLPATELIHYNYLFHPILGVLLKKAFLAFPGVNWYSIFLLLVHFVAMNVIAGLLFKRLETIVALLLYLLLFSVFEGWMLLNLGFNSAVLVLTIAGILLLLDFRMLESSSKSRLILAFVLLTWAAMIRVHPLVPLLGISIPFLLFPFKAPQTRPIITTLAAFAMIVFVAELGHQWYYTKQIPQWPEEEKLSQAIYRLYNDGRTKVYQGQSYRVELDLIAAGLPADKALLNPGKLKEIYQETIAPFPRNHFINQSTAYWFFVNWRLFFYVTGLIAITLVLARAPVLIPCISFCLLLAGLLTLSYFQRTPEYLLLGCLFLWIVLLIRFTAPFLRTHQKLLPQAIIVVLFIGWGIIRMNKMSTQHLQDQERFARTYQYIKDHRQFLFFNVYGGLPIKFMPIFSDPREYLLDNFLGSEHFLMNLHHVAFAKFSITAVPSAPLSNNVLFIGEPRKGLLNYFRYKGFPVSVKLIQEMSSPPVFQLLPVKP